MIHVLVALVLLTAGRRMFWLFVGCVGFIAGYNLAPEVLTQASSDTILVIGLILGFMGMFLAFFIQRAAIAISGFLAGCYITLAVLEMVSYDPAGLFLLLVALGGLLGVLMLFALFDVALVVLSSVAGASLMVETLAPAAPYASLLLVGLAIFGMLFQFRMLSPASNQQPAPQH